MDEKIELNAHNKEEHRPSHTAEHIINRAMDNAFHCGRAIGAHIERKRSKMDFAMPEEPTPEQLKAVEETVNRVVESDLPVSFSFMTQAEARGRFDLKRLPDGASEAVRVVFIGDYDECLCIGQHVGSTREIGHVSFASHDYDAERKILRIRFKVSNQSTD